VAALETSSHAIVKRPQCPACGDPKWMAATGQRAIELRPVAKAHVDDGGYRRQPPRQTYETFAHLVSPITGPVTHLVPMPGRNTELRSVYASGYMICPRELPSRSNVFDKRCAGKGRSAEQARVSALCEALERYSGAYQGDEARISASAEELGSAALPPAVLLNFSEAQARVRPAPGAAPRPELRVPAPLDATTRIDWTYAWSLSKRKRRYVPLTYCYAEAPPEAGTQFCPHNGNGVAAGTCLEEALLQGVLELVERDAVAIWWYNRLRRPAIDLLSFGDAHFDALLSDYARQGFSLWALDLTHDLRIPVCVVFAHHEGADRFAVGFGCHLDPHLAVQRALTEVNQLFEPAGSSKAPWDAAALSSREYLFPVAACAPITKAQLPRLSGADLRADLELIMSRFDDAGLELVVVDKTRPDIGLSVVQAIVPGLRHFWPRFGPGRLYDVPVALGWLGSALAERELNHVPLFV
jgi:ribosomal protein S12 methylthiotransferase accessory factor